LTFVNTTCPYCFPATYYKCVYHFFLATTILLIRGNRTIDRNEYRSTRNSNQYSWPYPHTKTTWTTRL